jgi:hypothetical protein
LHERTLRVEGERVEARRRRRGYLVEHRDVSRGRGAVLGGAVGHLGRGERELGVVGLVGLPLLEPWDDARRGHVVGGDEEVERAPGRYLPEWDPPIAIASAVDVDCNAIVVAITALVEARVAVREASRDPDAVRGCDDS